MYLAFILLTLNIEFIYSQDNTIKVDLVGLYKTENGSNLLLGKTGNGYFNSTEPLFEVGFQQFKYQKDPRNDEFIKFYFVNSNFPNDEISFKIVKHNGIIYLTPWIGTAAGNVFFKKQ